MLIEAKPTGGYAVHVRFEDSTSADVDLSYLLDYGGVFEPLRDPKYFRKLTVDLDAGTIVWPNEADIAPETLYAHAQRRANAVAQHLEAKILISSTLGKQSQDYGKLERSKFTRAGEVANERLIEAVLDPDRYPKGTTFIAADQEGFSSILAEAVAEHRPVAIFFPDGHEIVTA
jgi:Protein of unknown function (DUF2442)